MIQLTNIQPRQSLPVVETVHVPGVEIIPKQLFFKRSEVAALLGCGVRTVARLLANNELESVQVPHVGARITYRSLTEFVSSCYGED